MQQAPESVIASKMVRHRLAVWRVVDTATRPLTVAEVRRLARQRDPSLSSVLLVCAATDLQEQGRIQLAD